MGDIRAMILAARNSNHVQWYMLYETLTGQRNLDVCKQ